MNIYAHMEHFVNPKIVAPEFSDYFAPTKRVHCSLSVAEFYSYLFDLIDGLYVLRERTLLFNGRLLEARACM